MNWMRFAFVAASFLISTQSSFARNPLSGSPGAGSSSNVLTLSDYEAVCQGPGKVTMDVRSMTFNGHRQMFLHSAVQQFDSEERNSATATVFKGNSATLNLPIQNPITFQLSGGETLLTTVTYSMSHGSPITTTYVRHSSPFYRNGGSFVALVHNGHGSFSIPFGSGQGAIPKGATVINMSFQTIGNTSCTTYTTDLNNLEIGSSTAGITADSQSCGSGCAK